MSITLTKGDRITAPSWLEGEFAASALAAENYPPRIFARTQNVSGTVYARNITMNTGMVGLMEFISRFITEAAVGGITLAEIALTNPRAALQTAGSTSSTPADAFAGLGAFLAAALQSVYPQGADPAAKWVVLRVV